jgi:hypothetical protein
MAASARGAMQNGVNWIDITLKLGVPVVILLFGGWFFVRELWPWGKKMFEEMVARQRTDLDRFTESLSNRDKMASETNRETVKALEALTNEVRGMRDDIQEIRKGGDSLDALREKRR